MYSARVADAALSSSHTPNPELEDEMNSKDDSTYPSGDDLIAMRAEEEPIRYICQKLKVREMGPYDHIVTKHEVRDWLKAGGTDRAEADAIVQRAQVRRVEGHQRALRQAQQQQQGQTRNLSQ